jgi:hypothetical protein
MKVISAKLDIYVFIFIMYQLFVITYVGYLSGKLGLDKYCSVVVAVNVCVDVQPVPAENNKNE